MSLRTRLAKLEASTPATEAEEQPMTWAEFVKLYKAAKAAAAAGERMAAQRLAATDYLFEQARARMEDLLV